MRKGTSVLLAFVLLLVLVLPVQAAKEHPIVTVNVTNFCFNAQTGVACYVTAVLKVDNQYPEGPRDLYWRISYGEEEWTDWVQNNSAVYMDTRTGYTSGDVVTGQIQLRYKKSYFGSGLVRVPFSFVVQPN